MRYLFDTNVVSEAASKTPHPQVAAWIESLDQDSIYLSALTIGEIHRGVQRLPDSARRERLRNWLEDDVMVRYADRILILDVDTMLTWGAMVGTLELRGRVLPMLDSLLAAQAIHHRCVLATRNERDFEGTGVSVVNPWK